MLCIYLLKHVDCILDAEMPFECETGTDLFLVHLAEPKAQVRYCDHALSAVCC